MAAKRIEFDQAARESLLRGVRKLARASCTCIPARYTKLMLRAVATRLGILGAMEHDYRASLPRLFILQPMGL